MKFTLNPSHEAHIGRVWVEFELTGNEIASKTVTEALGLTPDDSANKGDSRENFAGKPLTPHREGWWYLTSRDKIDSKDLRVHFHYLLEKLLPVSDKIASLGSNCNKYFGVHWESSYLYAGTGPILDLATIEGVARLRAEMGFDIYQIEGD